MLFTVIVFLAVLLVLVLVHEWGHFIVARLHGMKVEEFGFGFPPRIGGILRRGTLYSLNWLPLGGFVRIKGENGDTVDPDSFAGQKPWRRATVLLAGVGMNVALAWVLFTTLLAIGVPTEITGGIAPGARVSNEELRIMGLYASGPAVQAGLLIDDVVLSVNGTPIKDAEDLRAIAKLGSPVTFEILRDDEKKSFTVEPRVLEVGGQALTGLQLAHLATVRFPLHRALVEGAKQTWFAIQEIFKAFAHLFSELATSGKLSADVAGPVGIAVITGDVARQGWAHILQFGAFLSLNLAILNIVPFPALDGGRLLFVIIEKLKGKPVRARTEALIHQIGFITLLLFVVLVTYRDIVRLGGGG
ncbi:MAG: M50 family metallopeptidase [bacterium]|nr:M50 family metallopeptidase [bacterium]